MPAALREAEAGRDHARVLATALNAAGRLVAFQGDFAQAPRRLEAGGAIWRALIRKTPTAPLVQQGLAFGCASLRLTVPFQGDGPALDGCVATAVAGR
jgi:hypothetical protein